MDPSQSSRVLEGQDEAARLGKMDERPLAFPTDRFEQDHAAATRKAIERRPSFAHRLSLDNQPLAGHGLAAGHGGSYSARR